MHRAILVLEDYHTITSPQIHKTMTFWLDHLPPSLHLVILTRGDPALPLQRLRVQDELCVLAASELCFSHAETQAFLQPIVPAVIELRTTQLLEIQLAGWAAGLRLFALSLQGSTAPHAFAEQLANFVSRYRPLQDYFVAEVLNVQPALFQTFLLHTCMLTRLAVSLCDVIMGGQHSAFLLESMERAGLFLERLAGPGEWYRYHALFAEAMRAEARRRLGTRSLQTISLQASVWYEQQGMLSEAIEAALQAEAMPQAAALIERLLVLNGFDNLQEFHTLRRWLELLPGAVFHSYPTLCLCFARILSLSFAPEPPTPAALTQIEALLQMAEASWRAEDNTVRLGEVFSFRAQNAVWQGAQEQAGAFARQALRWLPLASGHWRAVCLNILGVGEFFAGELLHARKTLLEALALWTKLHHPHGARSCTLLLAMLYYAQGELQLAAQCYRRVLNEARELGDRQDLVPALIGLAQLFYEWNDLEAAEHAAQEAWELGEQMRSQELMLRAALVLVRICYLRGQTVQVQQRLSALQAGSQARPDLYCEVLLCQVYYLLVDGDYATARRYLNSVALHEEGIPAALREEQDLLLARLLIQQGETHTAATILARLRLAAQEGGRGRMLLTFQILIAQVQYAERRVQDAYQTLQSVLSFARPEGYLRLFLDQGEALAVLLRAMQTSIQERPLASYLHTILRASDLALDDDLRQIVSSIEPLSTQELRVLRLLVVELSYPEIARELVVSVNTVKTQVSSIYRKLNVHTRREARAAVLRYQLL